MSIIQFAKDASRQKKEATLNAYNELQKDVFSKLNKFSRPLSKIEYLSNEWEEITGFLVKIENFSTGINTGIYSLDILNRLGGAYFIRQFENLKVIIDDKIEKDVSPGKHYDEFKKTVVELRKLRS